MDRKKPLYRQIYEKIKADIEQGTLSANMRLPSKRTLAEQAGVSVNTVEGAYAQLLCEGFIYSKPKSGFYVCEIEKLLPAQKQVEPQKTESMQKQEYEIDFSINGVDRENFPYSTWRKLMRYVFDEYDTDLLSRSPIQGEFALRCELARYLNLSRGVSCRAEQIIIGAGTANLLQILSYLLDNSTTIAMENPVYHESYLFFQRMGHNVLSIPIDHMGLPVKPLQEHNNIAAYITPAHQFPLGIAMPQSRRISLINWANEGSDRYLIEDDYDSEFRYNAKPLPALKSIDVNDRVIYLGSFSRAISPSLRISYMVLPEKLLEKYHASSNAFGCSVSKTDQLVLTQFIVRGHFETHLNKMRKIYRERRAILERALNCDFGDEIRISGENAGQHLLISHCELSEKYLCKSAQDANIKVYPISPYFMGNVPDKYSNTVLMGYATLNSAQISNGVSQLREIW